MSHILLDKVFCQIDIDQDKPAIQYKHSTISYRQFAYNVAYYSDALRLGGIQENDVVMVKIDNSPEAVIAIFAALVAGAICLPMNREVPLVKLNETINDYGVKMVLCADGGRTLINEINVRCIEVEVKAGQDLCTITLSSRSTQDFAFCILSSGSTGESKGILLRYDGIINLLEAQRKDFELMPESTICLSLNIGFVAAIWQVLLPFVLKTKLVIYDVGAMLNPYSFLKQAESDEVSCISLIPSSLQVYMNIIREQPERQLQFSKLQHIILTGENINADLVNEFYKHYSVVLVNCYGLTESTDDAMHYIIPRNTDYTYISLGKPIDNVSVCVMDEKDNEILDGEIGELCISGICVYSAKIIKGGKVQECPDQATRLLRTGDFARKREDSFQYIGRRDNQIKIAGKKVQIEEIEHCIMRNAPVEKGMVVHTPICGSDKVLIAFYTAESNLDVRKLVKSMSSQLPAYMIPAKFVRIDSFPTNSNGKLDRQRFIENGVFHLLKSTMKDGSLHDGVLLQVSDIIEEMTGLPLSVNDKDAKLEDLGINSLSFINLIVKIEALFSIEFEEDNYALSMFNDVASLANYITEKTQQP